MTSIGLLLPTREAVVYGAQDGDPRPLVELAVRAEEAGFDSVWAGDSLLAKPRAEPVTLLAGVATATSRVRLGTAVLLPSLRNPEQLAQATATLDALSGGRFILGVGGGPGAPTVRADHELVGADFDRRGSRSVEVVQRVRELWRHGAEPQMYPLTAETAGPPVWMGGSGPRTLERTGRLADGWFPTATSAEAFAEGLATVRAAATASGRAADEVGGAAYLTVTFGPAASAQRQLQEHSERYYDLPHSVVASQQGSLAGEAEAIVDWLRGFIEAGAEHLCLRLGSERIDDQFQELVSVLPELRR